MPTTAQDGLPITLFPESPFSGFGPSRFHPPDHVPVAHRIRVARSAELKAAVREAAPRQPGVYGMLDAQHRVIYIGKAKNLRSRLLSYFRPDSRNPKAGKIVKHTRTLLWEQTADEFAALLRELELIRHFRPRFNVLGQPGLERYVYLALGRGPVPTLYLTRQPKKKDLAIYGPFVGKGRILDAVRRVNLSFGLRDCPNTTSFEFAEQGALFPTDRNAKCLRYELGTCQAPCAGYCTRENYHSGVRRAKAFLDGRDLSLLESLQERMRAAAAELQFERAASLRDQHDALHLLSERLTFLRSARRRNSFVFPLAGPSGSELWYLIHGGEVRAAVPSPKDIPSAIRAAERIQEVFDPKLPGSGVLERCVDSVLIVTSWFRQHPEDRDRLLSAKDALALCVAASSSANASST